MRVCSQQASAQLTFFSWRGTTHGTTDTEYLLETELFLQHAERIMLQTHLQEWSILNTSGKRCRCSRQKPYSSPAYCTGVSKPTSFEHRDSIYDARLDCARTFAQRALCAAAMRSRAATDNWRFMRLPEPDAALELLAVTLLSAAITFSSCLSSPAARSRSCLNCSRTASRSAMHAPFWGLTTMSTRIPHFTV